MLDITKFGPRLMALRTEHGEMQEQMAIIFDCSRPTYEFYESGTSLPKLETFVKICNHYKVSASYFLKRRKTCPAIWNIKPGITMYFGFYIICCLHPQQTIVGLTARLSTMAESK